jgi:hypothetical protein
VITAAVFNAEQIDEIPGPFVKALPSNSIAIRDCFPANIQSYNKNASRESHRFQRDRSIQEYRGHRRY